VHLATLRDQRAGEDLQQRGLPPAVLPHDPQMHPAVDGEAEIGQHPAATAPDMHARSGQLGALTRQRSMMDRHRFLLPN
jgi:hypothetical protein